MAAIAVFSLGGHWLPGHKAVCPTAGTTTDTCICWGPWRPSLALSFGGHWLPGHAVVGPTAGTTTNACISCGHLWPSLSLPIGLSLPAFCCLATRSSATTGGTTTKASICRGNRRSSLSLLTGTGCLTTLSATTSTGGHRIPYLAATRCVTPRPSCRRYCSLFSGGHWLPGHAAVGHHGWYITNACICCGHLRIWLSLSGGHSLPCHAGTMLASAKVIGGYGFPYHAAVGYHYGWYDD